MTIAVLLPPSGRRQARLSPRRRRRRRGRRLWRHAPIKSFIAPTPAPRSDGRTPSRPPRRTPNKPPQSLFVAAAAPRFIPRTDFRPAVAAASNMRSGSCHCSLGCLHLSQLEGIRRSSQRVIEPQKRRKQREQRRQHSEREGEGGRASERGRGGIHWASFPPSFALGISI